MSRKGISTISDKEFNDFIGSHDLVLVDFYADWCGPCRMLTPVLEEIAATMSEVVVAKVDIEESQEVSTTLQVTSVPTLILFSHGKEVGRLIGLRDADAIASFITAHRR